LAKEAEKQLVSGILRGLSSGSPQQAWTDFLESYPALILQVVRLLESDPDDVANCFVFVCEQLSRKRFHRLRHFRADGPASFSTWLRAVTRNLSVDWYRSQHGRPQIFDSIAGLDALKQEIFRRVHQDGMSPDEAFAHVRARIPELTRQQFNESINAIERALTPRQRWLLSTRKQRFEPLEAEVCDGS
jgi:RNA polymerase sigma factor (sigma-70 family)